MKNSDKPAFPEHPARHNGLAGEEYGLIYGETGLTKREYFAAKAMQGLLSAEAPEFVYADSYETNEDGSRGAMAESRHSKVAKESLRIADEILKQLDNK